MITISGRERHDYQHHLTPNDLYDKLFDYNINIECTLRAYLIYATGKNLQMKWANV